jgi:hypothetical protein
MFLRPFLALPLSACCVLSAAAAEEAVYDVRGPAIKPGFKFHVTSEAIGKAVRFTYHGDSFPREKLKVGASWKVPPAVIAGSFVDETDLKATGEMTAKFIEVRTYEGRPCAVVRTEGRVRGSFKRDGKEATYDLEYEETRFRSLRHHTGLKSEGRCVITIQMPVKVGTEDWVQTVSGTVESTNFIKVLE